MFCAGKFMMEVKRNREMTIFQEVPTFRPPRMSPTPQAHAPHPEAAQAQDDDIVITGLSGLFPTCNNLKEFSEKLYRNENLVTNDKCRWKYDHPELTEYCGNLPNLEKFDAQFFMVHYRLSNSMDAMSRKLLEHAYQAVFDAGISPYELYGKKVGVFIGTCLTETEKVCAYSAIGVGIVGCNRAMFSNRISYWLNAKGPSMTIDAACSGSMVCMEKAYEAIKRGDCDSAIVGSSNIHLHPQSCIHYGRLLRMNTDGRTKCFDQNADGQSPAECISIIFLQKAKDAKRIYATVCNAKSQFSLLQAGHYDRYGPGRDPSSLSTFYQEFYRDSNISPLDVEYLEAFGSAFPEGDKAELEAIQEVFCKNRNDPLFIGSVMSNMGYSQASTTVAALTKVCLAYQTGKISANLNFKTPRNDIPAMMDGRMRVVTENKPFSRSYTAINSLSLTGINGHILLKGQYKPKDSTRYASMIPYLFTVSGRQESAVEKIFEDIKSHPIDPEEVALFHNIHKTRVSKHLARGFTILKNNENQVPMCVKEKVDYYDDAKRPLWFVYSGMGSQWNGMGTELMRIPIFAAAIHRCAEVLKPKGVDLMHILTSDDKEIFENILNSFVGIAAIQIGLTDVLLNMGLVPDNIIGHSVGELGCAYADGCLNPEEMILSAYYRGLVSVETPLIQGSMAAVGLGWQQIQAMCPHAIEVACHNAPESSTISGPSDIMRDFVARLSAQGIFAKEVNCSNIAYHSRYIKDAGPGLLKHLKGVIKNPKARSERWLSTSVPKPRWNEPAAQICSAEYLVNNLLNSVLFEETAQAIPANAVLIEVAPHGLLQAILKRFLPTSCTNIPMTRRGYTDNVQFLLEAIGGLYMVGYNPDLSVLYPKVEFPVSTETRSLSHLIEWVHTEKWTLPVYVTADRTHAAAYDVTLSTHDDEFSYLRGHIVDDQTRFPFAGALVFIWDTLAMAMEVTRKELSVQFREVHFHTQPQLFDNRLLKLGVEIHRGTGWFEMVNENILIATGYVEVATVGISFVYRTEYEEGTIINMVYTADDVYRMFYDRGYGYRGEFRSIQKENAEKSAALIAWNNNWVTLIDAAFQMNSFRMNNDVIEQPRFIQRLYIDVKQHNLALLASQHGIGSLEAYYFEDLSTTRCGGVVLENVLFTNIPPRQQKLIGVKTLQFLPFFQHDLVDLSTALYTFLQILEENTDSNMNVLDITERKTGSFLSNQIQEVLPELANIKLNMKRMTLKEIFDSKTPIATPDFMLVDDLLTNKSLNDVLAHAFPPEILLIALEEDTVIQSKYKVLASATTPNGKLVIGRWRPQRIIDNPTVIPVTSAKDLHNLKSTRNVIPPNGRLIILSHYPPLNELKDLVKQWKKETKRNRVCLAMVDKTTSQNLQAKQLPDFDLAYSVLHKGVWGGNYFIRSGRTDAKELKNVTLRSSHIGNLDSLHWAEAPAPGPKDIVVAVHYAGLNFYDAKKAKGDIAASLEQVSCQNYGMDFSGLTARGDRVMGLVRGGAASTRVSAEPTLLWPVPEHWSLEDAATVPLAYAHAFYCLGIKCKLYHGMSVLVHGAAGALGQAAISIALANHCQVFATVSDMKKKRLLRKMFPDLPDEHIGNSRDVTFGDMVLGATKGEGCNIIISCVKGHLKNITLSCCAPSGTTLDTQEVHSREIFAYGMYQMTRCRSYAAIDFSTVFDPENYAEMEKLQVMVSEGIARGYVQPLSRVTYGARDAARALRLLAASRHRGRTLLRIHGEELVATNRLAVQPKGSHLVLAASGDDDAVALQIVDLLVSRGAVNVVLHRQKDKEPNMSAYLDEKDKLWRRHEVHVKVSNGDLSDPAKVEDLIKKSSTLGPLDGVYVVIADTSEKTSERTLTLLANLDDVTRKSCPNLRYFSVININSDFGRNICLARFLDELPALMLQLPCVVKYSETNPKLEEMTNNDESVTLRNILPKVENALCSVEPVAVIYTYESGENMIDKVAKIPGVYISPKSDDKLTLRQVGLKREHLVEFLHLLQKYNVVLPKEKVPNMTLAELKSLQRKVDFIKTRVHRGLGVLYSSVDSNELLATAELIFLPTAAQKSTMRDDEFDGSATYLVMVPGMDGHYGRFQSLCERLKLSAAVVQPGLDHPHETVKEMAGRLAKVTLKRICPKEKFYLLGYSYGVLVALEMATILEDHGLTGVVFCVDASPVTFPTAIESWLREADATNEDKLQDEIVQHIYSLMAGRRSEKLTVKLQEAVTWNEKVEAGMRALRDGVPHSAQYARGLIEAAHARISQARSCEIRQPRLLRSEIVLMRSHALPNAPEDLGLSRYSHKKPHVYYLAADHANALDDLRCANFINRHIDKKILEDYHKKNLCNTYLLNASTYTQFSADYD